MQTEFEADELLALAHLDLQHGRVEQALQKAKKLLSTDSIPAEVLRMSAKLYAQLGLFGKAQKLFEDYLQIYPGALEEKFQLGMVHSEQGNGQQALQIWEDLLKQQPNFPPGLFYSALLLQKQGRISQAKAYLEQLLQTAAKDNLYVERAQELLQALEQSAQAQLSAAAQPLYQA